MGKKITQYSNSATVLEDGDLMDVSKYDGVSAYESQKFPISAFRASVLATAIRTASGEALAAGSNVVAFSSALPSSDYTLIIDEVDGVGVDKKGVVKTANGFTIDALEACNINYIAILNA